MTISTGLEQAVRRLARRYIKEEYRQRVRSLFAPPPPPPPFSTTPVPPAAEPVRAPEPVDVASLRPATEIREHGFAKVAGRRARVSVIYNYFKKESTVFKSIESVLNQTWTRCSADDVEIILVDDGTEGEDVAARLPEKVLYVWQSKRGYGICRAKNTGARLANGDYLLFLDPDIMIAPTFIDRMLEQFERGGDRLVQCGYVWDYHFEGCPDPRVEFGVWERPNRPTRRFLQVAGGCLALSRQLHLATPGFDEDLIYGGVEDILYGYHLSKLPGSAVMFNRDMESRHIPHPPGGAHADVQKSWEVVRLKWPEFYDMYMTRGLR